jgi:heat shock protein HslJ
MTRLSCCRTLAVISMVAFACTPRPVANNDTAGAADSAPASSGNLGATPTLENTDWKLVALGETPVTPKDTLRQAHFTLSGGADKRVTGSGGCNRMFGSYTLDGNALEFSRVGSTKMACAEGMDTESAFFATLARVAAWRIAGQQLELSDSTGRLLARFEPRATK